MPTVTELKEQIVACIAETFALDAQEIRQANELSQIDGWDSLKHLQIMMELEKEFGWSFDVDDIVSISSVDDIIELVQRKNP